MSELMRFRLTRAPQKRAVDPDSRVSLSKSRLRDNDNKGSLVALAERVVADPDAEPEGVQRGRVEGLRQPATFPTGLEEMEKWLTSVSNQVSPEQLSEKVSTHCGRVYNAANGAAPDAKNLTANARRWIRLAGATWWADRRSIAFSLVRAIVRNAEPSEAMYFNRLLLVAGLIELAAENPRRLRTASDVRWALQSRAVSLPHSFVDAMCRGGRWLTNWGRGTAWLTFVGDFDGDGLDDVLVWDSANGNWQVALSEGTDPISHRN